MLGRQRNGWLLVLLALPVLGGEGVDHHSKYAGLETREIKTLSAEDLEQLRSGHGWGLSLVAELNGVPGPRHVLDMREELELSAEQIREIEAIYDRMHNAAVPLGLELIRLEQELESAFAGHTIDDKGLEKQLDAISRTRKGLRYVHLVAHLHTRPLLTEKQIDSYNTLRGYGSGDPCKAVPPGHDPAMWKMHNHCDG